MTDKSTTPPAAAVAAVAAVATPDGTRRTMVAVAACTPLLAAAAALFKQRPAEIVMPAVVPAASGPADQVGYHETEHIRRYYRSAKYF